ncbi:unnamed protein product [Enterobius vermicularis]|uniref:CASP-like protein n=1 Tax=Enterobius vermicularis TaxID=51028 RepID=A0A0N4VI08_ENTVE|nr:unnamed protein product [Enterobius vermicularis]
MNGGDMAGRQPPLLPLVGGVGAVVVAAVGVAVVAAIDDVHYGKDVYSKGIPTSRGNFHSLLSTLCMRIPSGCWMVVTGRWRWRWKDDLETLLHLLQCFGDTDLLCSLLDKTPQKTPYFRAEVN